MKHIMQRDGVKDMIGTSLNYLSNKHVLQMCQHDQNVRKLPFEARWTVMS